MVKSKYYRAEIDGLRALAVIPVLFFHAGFSFFRGGYIGVDIFFVISGYLITGIIQREIKKQQFSLLSFYERRARRILPALFFICLICIPFAYLWMIPFELKAFSDSLISIIFFSSNVYFWQDSEYFSAAAELKPLLHTWSLSVEEQYYVIFPIFLLLLKKFKHSTLLLSILILSLLSLLLSEYASTHFSTANFYLLPTRVWELGMGALLAIVLSQNTPFITSKSSFDQAGSILGVAGILFSILYFDNTTPFPGFWALIPVFSTLLIITFASPENLTGKLLGSKLLVGIGLISYSTYLWHQPLFAFTRIRMAGPPTTGIYLLLIFISLLLGYFTWRFIETPFRNKKCISRKQLFSSATVFASFLFALSLSAHFKSGIFNEKQLQAAEMQKWSKDYNPRAPECHGEPSFYISPEDACTYNPSAKKKIAIWGDSHALGLAHILAKTLNKQNYDLTQFTYSACMPTIGLYKVNEPDSQCDQYNADVLNYIKKSKDLDIIVLHARWPLYIEGKRFDNKEGGREYGDNDYALPVATKNAKEITLRISKQERINAVGEQYRLTIKKLLSYGKKVVLVYSVPEAGWNVPIKLARDIIYNRKSKDILSTRFDLYNQRVKNAHQQLDQLADNPNLIRIYPAELFCNTTRKERCINQTITGEPLYFDDNHLNSIGALKLANKIVEALNNHHQI